MYWGLKEYASSCPLTQQEPGGNATVFDVGVLGKSYILVGSDPKVLLANQFQVTNSAHTGAPQPPGGTSSATSSDKSDTVTQVEGPPNNLYDFQFQTPDQSTALGDRTLTFKYTLSDGEGTSVPQSVTARKFAYLTNNNPSNQCTMPYGSDFSYDIRFTLIPTANQLLLASRRVQLLLKVSTLL